jgi:hypothetical protein
MGGGDKKKTFVNFPNWKVIFAGKGHLLGTVVRVLLHFNTKGHVSERP